MLGVVIEIGRCQWSEDHMSAIGIYSLICWRLLIENVNLRPDGAIRRKQRTLGWEG
jgi:hypothetical protein